MDREQCYPTAIQKLFQMISKPCSLNTKHPVKTKSEPFLNPKEVSDEHAVSKMVLKQLLHLQYVFSTFHTIVYGHFSNEKRAKRAGNVLSLTRKRAAFAMIFTNDLVQFLFVKRAKNVSEVKSSIWLYDHKCWNLLVFHTMYFSAGVQQTKVWYYTSQ